VNALSSYAKRVFDVNDRGGASSRAKVTPRHRSEFRRGGLNTFQVQASCTHDAGALRAFTVSRGCPRSSPVRERTLNEDKNTSIVRYQVQLPLRGGASFSSIMR